MEDAETGHVVQIDTGKRRVREAYRDQSRDRRARTANTIRSAGVDLLEFINGTNWLPALMNFFRKRRQRS